MSDVWPSAEEEKKRILILADSHGRNISGILSYVLRRKREVLVIFKPNATLGCVAEDIDKLTTSFTMVDVVVLIGGTNDLDRGSSAALVSTIEGLQRRLQQRTQLIVATLPRRYDNRKYNRIIDELNDGIRALRNRYGRMKILELGDMGKDYHTNQGLHLNIKGKVKLCLKLCKEMDSVPRTSLLRPPMRKVADFLKLFTLPDGHKFNYESPRKDINNSYMNTSAVSQAAQGKLHRIKLVVIETRITVPTNVGIEHRMAENIIPKPFQVFLGPSGERREDDKYSDLQCLRTKRANSYWAGNTFCIYLYCHTNKNPSNVRIGSRRVVKLLVTESQPQIIFTVTESGLKFTMNQEPAVIIFTLDVRKFFNVDKNKNVNYMFEESTVGAIFSKRRSELKLKIRSNMRLSYSAVVRNCIVEADKVGSAEMTTSGREITELKLTLQPDSGVMTFLVNEAFRCAEDVDGESRRIPTHVVVVPKVTFEGRLFTLRPDVAVFRPIFVVSSHHFVIHFISSDRVEIAHYAEFFVINNASLVQYVSLPLCTCVVLSSVCPKRGSLRGNHLSRATLHGRSSDSRIVAYNRRKTRTEKLYFANENVRCVLLERGCICHHVSVPRDTDSEENERSEGDVVLTESLIRAIKQCLLCSKMKNSAAVPSNKAKIDAACPKLTRKARNTGVPEIAKQLTKVTTTYLSCCGDFNTAMIARRFKSKTDSRERDSKSLNSSSSTLM